VRRRTLVLGAGALAASAAAAVQGLVVMGPTAEQGNYSRLLVVHPALAFATYLVLGLAALASALWLWPRTRRASWDHLAGASAEVGVLLCALTLATGSIWGRPVWGVWWTWDARLTSTALLCALFLGYLALRRVPATPVVRARRCAVAALVAALDMPVVHYATKWWRTLHQGRTFRLLQPEHHLDTAHLVGMLLGVLAVGLAAAFLVVVRTRAEALEQRYEAVGLSRALAERRAEAEAGAERAPEMVGQR